MKRSPLSRNSTPMRRTRLRPKRPTPRRREAPRWTADEWFEANLLLQRRAGVVCECCHLRLGATYERHHRQRRRDGGDRLANLLILRPECHAYWTAHPAEAMARGIIVPTHADPAEIPVLWRSVEWSLLDDSGARSRLGLDPAYRITG